MRIGEMLRLACAQVRSAVWRATWRGVRAGTLLRWALSPYRRPPAGTRRALLVYDFSCQPVSLGDLLVARVAAECLRIRDGVQRVDIAFLNEPRIPGADEVPQSFDDVGQALQAVRLDPELGSIYFFAAREDLETFIDTLPREVLIWPPPGYYTSGQYVYYLVWNELIHDCFHRFGRVPQLHAAPALRAWADAFVAARAGGRLAISVQLRRNAGNPARNSDFEAWLAFFARCAEQNEPCVFFIVGWQSESDPRLSACSNVVIAKSAHTGLAQDLALMDACAAHMGASSGPSTMSFFSDKPYVLFGWITTEYRYRDLIAEGNARRFYFARPDQRLIAEVETAASIDAEYLRIRQALAGPAAAAAAVNG